MTHFTPTINITENEVEITWPNNQKLLLSVPENKNDQIHVGSPDFHSYGVVYDVGAVSGCTPKENILKHLYEHPAPSIEALQ